MKTTSKDSEFWWCRHRAQALPEIALFMNRQIYSTTGESRYRVVFKHMRMQRQTIIDRLTTTPGDENLNCCESDSSDKECENGSSSLVADDWEYAIQHE